MLSGPGAAKLLSRLRLCFLFGDISSRISECRSPLVEDSVRPGWHPLCLAPCYAHHRLILQSDVINCGRQIPVFPRLSPVFPPSSPPSTWRPSGDAVLLQIIPVSEPWDREPDVSR